MTTALRQSATRSEDMGQGNGLAGTLEIVKKNRGGMLLWTGNVVCQVEQGEEKGFVEVPELPGTGVSFSLDTRNPIDLTDTWIASTVSSPLVTRLAQQCEDTGVIDIAGESSELVRARPNPE